MLDLHSILPPLTRGLTLALAIVGAASLAGPGCANSPDGEGARFIGPTLGSPQTATITADWDDVDAAVEVGVGQAEMAVISEEAPSREERIFYLRTIRDEPAKLTITRTSSASPATISLEARAGIFGAPDEESRLIRAVSKRLLDLKGVEFAPVRE